MAFWKRIFGHPPRASRPPDLGCGTAAWEEALTADSRQKGDLQQKINDFFVPDGISPLAFSANLAALTGRPIEEYPPTPSVAVSDTKAALAGNDDSGLIARTTAPSGYPTWFLAAYPDVALWMNRKVEKDAQAVLTAVGELPSGPTSEFFRRLIQAYRKETRQGLECAEYSPEEVKSDRQLSRARSLEHWKEAVRVSYKEHARRAQQEGRSALESHQIGLYGALASRYLTRTVADSWGRPHHGYVKDAEQRVSQKKELLWAELVPFLLMSQADALEALVEYAVVEDGWPEHAREDWLVSVIEDALRTLPRADSSIRRNAVLALQQYEDDIHWTFLIDEDIRETLMEALGEAPKEPSAVVKCRCGHLKTFHVGGRCLTVKGSVYCSCTAFQPE